MIGLVMTLVVLQTAEVEVTAALAKTRSAERYAFKVETTLHGGDSVQSAVVEGRYQKDQPVWMKSGELEVYRKAEVLVALKKGEWRPETRATDRRRVRGAYTVGAMRTLKLPHEELSGLSKRFTAFRKLDAKEGDQDVYVADLTEEAARSFIAANSERREEGTPEGTGRFWITPAGEVAMVEIIARVKKGKGREYGFSMWITIREHGVAKVEVPEAAAKALEEKED